jgi:hypothetical protein
VGTFADTAFGKFVETTDGLRGHRLELDGIIAKLEALRILEAARGQADAGLTTAGFSH